MTTLLKPPPPVIRAADPSDMPFIRDLQIKLREALGWIGNSATEFRVLAGHVNAIDENGEIAGFILSAPRLATAKWIHPIFQAAIHYDLRRRHHGIALIAAEEQLARKCGCSIVSLWCAADLEANDFWRSAGYTNCGVRTGGKARRRTHLLWRKPLNSDALLLLNAKNPNNHNGPGGAYQHGNTARTNAHGSILTHNFDTDPYPITQRHWPD